MDVRAVSVPLGLDEQEENAVLHAYWSALLANTYGPTKAEGISLTSMNSGTWSVGKANSTWQWICTITRSVGILLTIYLSGVGIRTPSWSRPLLQAEREGILMMIVDGELKPTSPVNNALPLDVIASPHQFRQR